MASNESGLADEDGDNSDWIEISNPDTTPVDLSGWRLTDDASDLSKWVFPSVTIPAGGTLVVFASDKDRDNPASELHTNFKLSSSGEYLALVRPDGTVVSDFSPSYPPQRTDVSYGVSSLVTPFTDTNTPLRYMVPTSDLGSTWTALNYDDSAWKGSRNSDVGVVITEVETGGTDAVEVQNVSGGSVNTTGWRLIFGQADADINVAHNFAATLPTSMASNSITTFIENQGTLGNIFWQNNGTRGWVMLLNANREVMDFAVWGYSDAQIRAFNLNATISGISYSITADDLPWSGAGAGSGSNFSNNLVRSGNSDTDSAGQFTFTSFASMGSQNGTLSTPFVFYGQTQARVGLGFDTSSTDYAPLLRTYVDTNTESAYMRMKFNIVDKSAVNQLRLSMRYDDGFVAYLNGTQVAAQNPPTTVFNNASGDHEDNGEEFFTIANPQGLLSDGDNVLAVHALNISSASSDFLCLPVLEAVEESGLGFFTAPTPNGPNGTGLVSLGPDIRDVTENIPPVSASAPLLITAQITSPGPGVQSAVLVYRRNFESEQLVAMVDNGTAGDAVANDGIYTGQIPVSALTAGQMIRWKVRATEATTLNVSVEPAFLDASNSPEYFGAVVDDPSNTSQLQNYHWFVANPGAAITDTGTRASLYANGRFYDNMFVRRRGNGTTLLSTNKQSLKFEFNEDYHFTWRDGERKVDEININTTYTDKSYIRQVVSWELIDRVGLPGSESFPIRLQQNGSFYSVAVFVEQPDRDFLRREPALDEDGAFYKMFNQMTDSSNVRKVSRKEENNNDLQALVNGVSPSNGSRNTYLWDNVDVASTVNYMAAMVLLHENDDPAKNYYMYRDTEGTREWRMLPWDKDLTFGRNYVISGSFEQNLNNDTVWADNDDIGSSNVSPSHPFYGDDNHQKNDALWNRLKDAVLDNPTARQMYLRRLRTLMDDTLQSSATPLANRWLEGRFDHWVALASADTDLDRAAWGNPYGASQNMVTSVAVIKNDYLPRRRTHLFVNHLVGSSWPGVAGIPTSQPSQPAITVGTVEFNPSGGNQEQEYIELENPNNYAVDVSGWTLSIAVDYTFPPGSVIPANSQVYVSPNPREFRQRAQSPSGGQQHYVSGPYSGHLSNFPEAIVLRRADGSLADEGTYVGAPSVQQLNLVISEFSYNPGDLISEAEFVEILNISDTETVSLTGVQFTEGIEFDFTGSAITSLAPGERALVVRNQSAFESVHGTSQSSRIAGVFANSSRLDGSGEKIKLEDPSGSTIHEFTYSDEAPWPVAADGAGYSLVLICPENRPDHSVASNWRISSQANGNPGTGDSVPFVGVASNDVDVDGLSALVEYLLGTDDNDPADGNDVIVVEEMQIEANTYATIRFQRDLQADDAEVVVQVSYDLVTWLDVNDAAVVFVSETPNGDGTSDVVWRSSQTIADQPKQFMRLKVTEK